MSHTVQYSTVQYALFDQVSPLWWSSPLQGLLCVRVPAYSDLSVSRPVSVCLYVSNGKRKRSSTHCFKYIPSECPTVSLYARRQKDDVMRIYTRIQLFSYQMKY